MVPPLIVAGGVALGRLIVRRLVARGVASRAAAQEALRQGARAATNLMQRGAQRFNTWRRNCRRCDRLNKEMCARIFGGTNNPPQPGVYVGGPHNQLGRIPGVLERHHIPPAGMGGLHRNWGPAIQMDYADHLLTPGHSGAGRAWRQTLSRTLGSNGFLAALGVEAAAIKAIPGVGNKYDAALTQAAAYAACLEAAGEVRTGPRR